MHTPDSFFFALTLLQGVLYVLSFVWVRAGLRSSDAAGVVHSGGLRLGDGLLSMIGFALIAGAANGAGADELLLGFATAAVLLLGKLVRAIRGDVAERDIFQAALHAVFAAAWIVVAFR